VKPFWMFCPELIWCERGLMKLSETVAKKSSGDIVVETCDEGSEKTEVNVTEDVKSEFHDVGEEVRILLLRREMRLTEVIEIIDDIRGTFARVRWES